MSGEIAGLRADRAGRPSVGGPAVVTGAGSGIGAAAALRLGELGAPVTLVDVDGAALDRTLADLRRHSVQASARVVDISDEDAVRAFFSSLGPTGLSVLVNAAGIVLPGTTETLERDAWDRTIAVNLTGTWLCAKYAVPLMRRLGGGSIVNVGSTASLVGFAGLAAYAASKGGVALLTRAMALDLAPDSIRVNCVCPGHINTPLGDRFIASHTEPERFRQELAGDHPIGRLGEPVDVAEVIAFLAGPGAAFMTGAVIPVDGGYTAR
ncbi:MAG: SDR family NAD(P)-dependent oxidoreductase [Chloroflexi bacterium]|nr:SDR family NAD(P)-dependent oxidoreductase [Chloroflexota bacterium]